MFIRWLRGALVIAAGLTGITQRFSGTSKLKINFFLPLSEHYRKLTTAATMTKNYYHELTLNLHPVVYLGVSKMWSAPPRSRFLHFHAVFEKNGQIAGWYPFRAP